MMRNHVPSLLAVLAVLTALICALPAARAAAPAKKGVSVSDAWAPPSITPDMGVAYLQLANLGAVDDALTGAESACCGAVEVHEDYTEGSIARMRQVPRLKLPAGQSVIFKSGGLHLMLVDLKAPLKNGEHFLITLHFAHAPDAKVTVTVSQARLLESLKSPRAN